MNETLKAIGGIIITLFCLIGITLVITVVTSKMPVDKFVTTDYINTIKVDLVNKIGAFKDSSMKYVNKPIEYNRYADSANKYITIYNYINHHK